MLIDQFNRIPEFPSTSPAELWALAAHAQVLCIPASRCLAQPGRELTGYFFLLKGGVQTFVPDAELKSSEKADLCHFYPGCAGARTTLTSQVLRIDSKRYEFLLTHGAADDARSDGIPDWLERFLTSDMMSQLPPNQWREVLKAFVVCEYAAATPVLQSGDLAPYCCVLEQGHAVVHRDSTTLAHLGPGDFFGEDALIVEGRRNADVTSLEPVRLQCIDKKTFNTLLLNQLVQFVQGCANPRGTLLNIGSRPMSGAVLVTLDCLREQLAGFDPRLDYYITGGKRCERALCAFLFTQRGLRAYPLA
jgi:hypothetical protein